MKKTLSLLFTLFACAIFSISAYADTDPCFTATYTNIPNGFIVPEEILKFQITEDPDNPKSEPISYGNQTQEGAVVTVPILLPEDGYSKVGIYSYTIKQNEGSTLGIEYDPDSIVFRVIVGYDNAEGEADHIGIIATGVGNVVYNNPGSNNATSGKKSGFQNICNKGTYGKLAVTNTVSGNLADRQTEFFVTVTFIAPEDKNVSDAITYTGPSNSTNTISAASWDFSSDYPTNKVTSVTIKMKNKDTVTFSNVPEGVEYSVTQTEVNGYKTIVNNPYNIICKNSTANAEVTNTMSAGIDTGIFLQRVPYIIVLVGGIVGLVLVLRGKRKRGF